MKNLKQKKHRYIWKTVILPALVCAVLVGILFLGIREFASTGSKQDIEVTRIAICRAAVQCYACEGIYPPDIDYLIEHYYVNFDENKYAVDYECFASNIMPNIFVYQR